MHYPALTILIFCLLWKQYEGRTLFKSKKIECVTNPDRDKGIASMDCDLLKPLRNVSMQLKIFKKDYTNKYQPFLVDITVNMCDVIAKRNHLIYGTIFWKLLQRYTNINHSCPIVGHLTARDIYVDENYLPSFPLGFYQFMFDFYDFIPGGPKKWDHVGKVKLYVEAMEEVKIKTRNVIN